MGTTAKSPRSNFKRLLEALKINPMRCFFACKSKNLQQKYSNSTSLLEPCVVRFFPNRVEPIRTSAGDESNWSK